MPMTMWRTSKSGGQKYIAALYVFLCCLDWEMMQRSKYANANVITRVIELNLLKASMLGVVANVTLPINSYYHHPDFGNL